MLFRSIRYRLGDRVHVLVSRVDLDARKIEFSLMKGSGATDGNGSLGRRQLLLAADIGKPNKKAASKKSKPSHKTPQKSGGINVNAAKSAGTLGASQSKSKASRKNGKTNKSSRPVGKPASSKPPVRKTKARRK